MSSSQTRKRPSPPPTIDSEEKSSKKKPKRPRKKVIHHWRGPAPLTKKHMDEELKKAKDTFATSGRRHRGRWTLADVEAIQRELVGLKKDVHGNSNKPNVNSVSVPTMRKGNMFYRLTTDSDGCMWDSNTPGKKTRLLYSRLMVLEPDEKAKGKRLERNVVPLEVATEAIIRLHTDPKLAHKAGYRLYKHAREYARLTGLARRDFMLVKNDCTQCVKQNPRRKGKSRSTSTKLDEEIEMNLIDLRETPSTANIGGVRVRYVWILSLKNTKTKLSKHAALTSRRPSEVISAFLPLWISLGMSRKLLFDKSTAFSSEIMRALTDAFGVRGTTRDSTPSGSKEIKPSTIFKSHLFSFMLQMQVTKWHLLLPFVELSAGLRRRSKMRISTFHHHMGRSPPITCNSENNIRLLVRLLVEAELTPEGEPVKTGTYFKGLCLREKKNLETQAKNAAESLDSPDLRATKADLREVRAKKFKLSHQFAEASGNVLKICELSKDMVALTNEEEGLKTKVEEMQKARLVDEDCKGILSGLLQCSQPSTLPIDDQDKKEKPIKQAVEKPEKPRDTIVLDSSSHTDSPSDSDHDSDSLLYDLMTVEGGNG